MDLMCTLKQSLTTLRLMTELVTFTYRELTRRQSPFCTAVIVMVAWLKCSSPLPILLGTLETTLKLRILPLQTLKVGRFPRVRLVSMVVRHIVLGCLALPKFYIFPTAAGLTLTALELQY